MDYQITDPQLEVLVDGNWAKACVTEFELGDRFRKWIYPRKHMKWVLYEDDNGNTEWVVVSKPYMHPEMNAWTVDVTEVPKDD